MKKKTTGYLNQDIETDLSLQDIVNIMIKKY